MKIKGAELFVRALQAEGVKKLFAYPGAAAIDLFDALYDVRSPELVLPRHEQALVFEADGYARATGEPGVCLVTSGPGATNTVTGIASANYDSVPLVVFCGQVQRDLIGNDAFQEVDIVGMTHNICKWSVTVRDRDDLGKIIKEAFFVARSGRPGPVVVDLPKDIQTAMGPDEYPQEVNIRGYKPSTGVHLGQVKRALSVLAKAKKPLLLAGGGVIISGAQDRFTEFAHRTGAPVITTIMGKGAIPSDDPLYVGNLGIHGCYAANKASQECDVLFSIGTRFNDRITGKINEFARNAVIVHVDIDAASISRNIVVDIPIVADAGAALDAMLPDTPVCDCAEWKAAVAKNKKDHPLLPIVSDELTPMDVLAEIDRRYDDFNVTTDVGLNQMWTTQFLSLRTGRRLMTSGGLGAMGYGLPAALGALEGAPDKKTICVTGDGGFQMNIQELATAVKRELPAVICLFNNSYLGNVRQWQELFYDKRYSCTCLRRAKSCGINGECAMHGTKVGISGADAYDGSCPPYVPDFIALAAAYGIDGARVSDKKDIQAAFDRADVVRDRPFLIEFLIDPGFDVLPMTTNPNNT